MLKDTQQLKGGPGRGKERGREERERRIGRKGRKRSRKAET